MTRAAIISTTINAMPNMDAWTAQMSSDDVMIITGDLKSPHAKLEAMVHNAREEYGLDVRYVSPGEQEGWQSSAAIPWNSIQRRNIAILEAIDRQPEFIVTIDDDNYPAIFSTETEQTWLDAVHDILTNPVRQLTRSDTGWFNPGVMCNPPVTHRGFPLERRNQPLDERMLIGLPEPARVGVFAALWYGDPDIDAMERIVNAPEVFSITRPNRTLNVDTWAPFNSQSTAYLTALAPLMMCMPFVGRMDDIWASYVARTVMDHLRLHVQYGHPAVRQERNEHNLVRDLRAELNGYEYTGQLCEALQNIELPDTTLVDELLTRVVDVLWGLPYVPEATISAYGAWISDLIALDNTHADARLFDTSKIGTDK